ncbi:fam-a protein [Plasmodium vinckei brucechwatti]|uniref:Fam-a protein n=1 Tax=Plasmodium vinckei brucechwatti TaxID=119398 RepID=A0A6V7SNG0_PLAVN|nr:fam-a protein [Plasmodium vinckei brucechwatti]
MNKGYIKIALALLSVASYMQNIAFARNTISTTKPPSKENVPLPASPEEAKQAADVMAEALAIAQKHAQNSEDYKLYSKEDEGAILYFKKINETEIGKLDLIIQNPDSYADVVSMIWDPNGAKNFDNTFIEGSVPQVYNENLVIIQQRYKSAIGSWQRYYHALANKVELSKDETAILLVSSDMNDHDGYCDKKYVNPIVKSANSFKPDINSQEDIRKGGLSKMYVNLVAFFIKKEEDSVKVTYISSVDPNVPWYVPGVAIKKALVKKFVNMIKLREIFKKA